MIPIIQLLSKIKWDKSLKNSEFKIGYIDNVSRKIKKINYQTMILEKNNKFSFKIIKDEKEFDIPFHRIRAVWQDNTLIWKRK